MILARDFYSAGVSCLHPKHLRNKYDHLWYTVPCRKCPACIERQRHTIVSRLETLRANSASCFFVTLTYNDFYLPLAKFDAKCEHCSVTRFDLLHRRKFVEDYDLSVYNEAVDRLLLRHGGFTSRGRHYGSHLFGVLVKSDLQKFFKRFRKSFHALLSSDFDFKYFAVGEYGVESFRPHFHAIVYCNRPLSGGLLRDLVRMSWRYGRIDVQKVRSSASSYCASYINAASRVPAFLRAKQFAPFKVCSNGSFFEMWPEQVDAFYLNEFGKVPVLHALPTKDGYALRPYSRSVRLQFYPVLPGFHSDSVDSLRRRYSVFKEAVERQETFDPVFRCQCYYPDSGDRIEVCDVPYSMLYAFSVPADSKNKRTFECILHRDFMDIYISRKVYFLALDNAIPFDEYVDTIISYYKGCNVEDCNDYAYGLRHYSTSPTDELPSSSFALSLLRSQYSAMESNVTCLDDLKLYYDQYNNRSSKELYKIGDEFFNIISDDDCFSFSDLLDADTADNLSYVSSMSELQSGLVVKHKERNTYYALQNKKCFI